MTDEKSYIPQATLFGRNLGEIPCFRSSFLYGISGGIGTGLAYFMLTSKVKQSCHTAVLSFTGITLAYWMYCRYSWSQRKFNMTMLQAAMKEQMLNEGTSKDPHLKKLEDRGADN